MAPRSKTKKRPVEPLKMSSEEPAQAYMALHPVQKAFTDNNAKFRGYVGGVGAGKSVSGAYDLCRRCEPGYIYAVVAPSFRMLEDSTMRTFVDIAEKLGLWNPNGFFKSEMRAVLNNNSEVLFRSGDNPGSLRGPTLRGTWLDECSQAKEEVFNVMIGRLRAGGEQGWLTGTFTPAGKEHWTYRIFGDKTNPNVALFNCSTKDNPFVSRDFYETLLLQYGKGPGGILRAQQELEGKFVCVEGAEWGPECFGPEIWFDEWPAGEVLRVCALDSSKGIGGKSGDYSVFSKVMVAHGQLWVEFDMDNLRNADEIASQAVEIQRTWKPAWFGIEEEFGGHVLIPLIDDKATAADMIMPVVPISTNNVPKNVRIQRLGVYLNRKQVRFRNTEQTKLGVNQFEIFPHGQHEDSCFIAGTSIDTLRGSQVIDTMRDDDFVRTREGYFPIKAHGCTGHGRTLTLHLGDGRTLTGTPNHPIFANNSWVPLGSLKIGDRVTCRESTKRPSSAMRLSSTESHFVAIQTPENPTTANTTVPTPSTSRMALAACTSKSGSRSTDPFRQAMNFITRTAIRSTTPSGISLASPRPSTTPSILRKPTRGASPRRMLVPLPRPAKPPRSGTHRPRGLLGTRNMARMSLEIAPSLQNNAPNAAAITRPAHPIAQCSAIALAASGFTRTATASTCHQQPTALIAESHSRRITLSARSTRRDSAPPAANSAHSMAPCGLIELPVMGISESGDRDVFNLSVDGTPEYFANGILVHNCDSLEMACRLLQHSGMFEEQAA